MTAVSDSGFVWCQVEQISPAPCDVTYDVLLDVEGWSQWAPSITAGRWDRVGLPETGQDGVRCVCSDGETIRERILVGHRPHYHSYVTSLPSNWIYSGMQSDVRITPLGGGSRIDWTVSCMARTPILAATVKCRVQHQHVQWAAALAAESGRRYRELLAAEPPRAVPSLSEPLNVSRL